MEWVEKEEAQVVQTAWAVMGLMYAKYPRPEPIERAVKLVMSRQLPVRFTTLGFVPELTFTSSRFRMVRGRRKQSKECSTGRLQYHIQTSSSRSQSGCWARPMAT